MCTAISYKTKDHYFGRNLDLEYRYNERVTITPRNYPLRFRCVDDMDKHYAMIGMAIIEDNFPLYYDATNEYGLSAAGLNFPGNACYFPKRQNKTNITPFELIPWLLGKCRCIEDVKQEVENLNIADIPFSEKYPLSPLHWMISDGDNSLVLEQTELGLEIYENDIGVLTNNPPFPYHLYNLQNHMHLSPKQATNNFSQKVELVPYSNGMGAIGLPGDLSSASRFVRAAFIKLNSISADDEYSSISQFFHILDSVKQTRGAAHVNDSYEITLYSSCCNSRTGAYYYKTYQNSQISVVHLHNENLDGEELISFPIITEQKIYHIN